MDFRQHTPYQLPACPRSDASPQIHLYSDGAYFKQHHLGGWGVAIYDGENRLIKTLHASQLANSSLEMELIAAIKALQWTQQHQPDASVALYTDAQILLEGLFIKYPNWLQNNWHSTNGNPVVFAELWQQLYQLATSQPIDFYWIKGHTNNVQNQLADHLARQKILQIHAE